jgi:RNA polymerase sigma-70 factor (ECF subfamily)
VSASDPVPPLDEADRALLARYVRAFELYDMDALTAQIQEDATQSMPPFDMWLQGREDIFCWWVGPGIGCKGSQVIPTVSANGSPAFGQYKPSATGAGVARLQRRDPQVPAMRATAATARTAPAVWVRVCLSWAMRRAHRTVKAG